MVSYISELLHVLFIPRGDNVFPLCGKPIFSSNRLHSGLCMRKLVYCYLFLARAKGEGFLSKIREH